MKKNVNATTGPFFGTFAVQGGYQSLAVLVLKAQGRQPLDSPTLILPILEYAGAPCVAAVSVIFVSTKTLA